MQSHMMTPPTKHDPANIFTVAEQFRSADKMLNLMLRQELTYEGHPVPFDVSIPMVTCAAFALELYLKCLISMETGDRPPNTHDYVRLFGLLHNDSKTAIRNYFDKNSGDTVTVIKRAFEQSGRPAPTVDFDYVLSVSRRAFPIARYLYEGVPAEQGWVAETIMEGARRTILKRFPHWEKARLVSPLVVRTGP